MCHSGFVQSHKKEKASMSEVSTIGVDLAKRVFQVHGALPDGNVAFRKKLSRSQFMKFLAEQPPCLIAMEACATAHYWGREALGSGHEVRLIPPIYVKPFVKRQKNDAADAEAALRPTMRFVEVKSADQQSLGLLFRTRELLVRQRTQLINALRGHLAEYGIIVAIGARNLKVFQQALLDHGTRLPKTVLSISGVYFEQIAALTEKVTELEIALRRETARDGQATLLQTMPGIGPLSAAAIQAFAPPLENFARGRDFAAWQGLVPRQHSSGGKDRLGRISKMGQRDIRRLLIVGAMSIVNWASRKGSQDSWLMRLLESKPKMVVAVALANKMARRLWAMCIKKEVYEIPVLVA
jgi:transposase